MVSYVLTFMLGTCFGGFIAIFAMACCVVASEHGAKAADAVSNAQAVKVGGTDD